MPQPDDETIDLPRDAQPPCRPQELLERLPGAGRDFLLLDVRTPEELALASVPGALHIPMQEVPHRLSELASWRDREVVVLCHHGVRSDRVRAFLASREFTRARNLAGGIDALSRHDPSIPAY